MKISKLIVRQTDIFAVGYRIYFIIEGHPVFLNIIEADNRWQDQVHERVKKQEFPEEVHTLELTTLKCWRKEYESAEEIIGDIILIKENVKVDNSYSIKYFC
jgi:hypothetical protein